MIAKLILFLLVTFVLLVIFFVVMPILLAFTLKGLYKKDKELRKQEKMKYEMKQKESVVPKSKETPSFDRFTKAREDLNKIIQEAETPEHIKVMAENLLEEIDKLSRKNQNKKEEEALVIFKTIEQMLHKNHQNT